MASRRILKKRIGRIIDALFAECVAVIGRKVILYRRSSRKNFEHIQF